jgi:hypothetical protein
MKFSLRHIVPFLALMALFGLGEAPVFNSTVISLSVLTEWVSGTNSKVSKSIHYYKCFRNSGQAGYLYVYSPVLLELTDLEQRIIISLQSATYNSFVPLIQLASGVFFHSLTIDHIKMSAFKAELLLSPCPIPGPVISNRTLMWNSMYNDKWLNPKRKDSSCLISSLEQSKQPGVGFI